MRPRQNIVDKAKEMGYKVYPNDEIKPGDRYIAWRNGDPQLLTCKFVRPDDELFAGWVVPVQRAYCFDIPECVKVTR